MAEKDTSRHSLLVAKAALPILESKVIANVAGTTFGTLLINVLISPQHLTKQYGLQKVFLLMI